MEIDKHRKSQQDTPFMAARQARSTSSHSMGPPHQRNLQSQFSPKQNGHQRNAVAQQYYSDYAVNGITQSQIANPQLQPVNPAFGISQYDSYQQINERSHHANTQTGVQQYPTFTSNTVLPPLSSTYDMIPQYPTRPSHMSGSIQNQFSTHSYPQSNNPMSICIENNATHLITSQPELSTYDSISFCRPEISAPYIGYANGYEFPEPSNAQSENELDESPDDTHPTIRQCELTVKPIFDDIVSGRLNDASEKLLAASQWLSSSIVQLEFHLDNEEQYQTRLTIWRNFNHCWEALAQKQKNILQQELRTKRKLSGKLLRTKIQRLVDDLITICDHLEEFGLVDYEMGLWEEQIIAAFISCVDLQNKCDVLFSDKNDSDKKHTKRISPAV